MLALSLSLVVLGAYILRVRYRCLRRTWQSTWDWSLSWRQWSRQNALLDPAFCALRTTQTEFRLINNSIRTASRITNYVLNTRRDDRLVYSLQAIGRRDYANEHQSQRNVWREYMYCVITLVMTSHCLRWKWSPSMITPMLVGGIS